MASKTNTVERGFLTPTEPHPSARSALDYIRSLGLPALLQLQESFSSCAIEGNRLGEVCAETLRRILDHEPVSDRYILGLAWAVKNINSEKK